MVSLRYNENFWRCLFVSTKYTNMTDRRTDGHRTAWRHRPRLHSIAGQINWSVSTGVPSGLHMLPVNVLNSRKCNQRPNTTNKKLSHRLQIARKLRTQSNKVSRSPKWPQRSLKVIRNVRFHRVYNCDFLLPFHCDSGRILCRSPRNYSRILIENREM